MVLIILFIIANLVDLITAYYILCMEANIILTKGAVLAIIILKISIIIGAILIDRYLYIIFISFMLIGTLVSGFGVYSNLQGETDCDTKELHRVVNETKTVVDENGEEKNVTVQKKELNIEDEEKNSGSNTT